MLLYSYVLLVAASTFFINTTHVLLTSKFRKASGLKYPVPYASNEQAQKDTKAYMFNCGSSFLPNPSPAQPDPTRPTIADYLSVRGSRERFADVGTRTQRNAPTPTLPKTSPPSSGPCSSPGSASPSPAPPSVPAGPSPASCTPLATPALLAPRAASGE